MKLYMIVHIFGLCKMNILILILVKYFFDPFKTKNDYFCSLQFILKSINNEWYIIVEAIMILTENKRICFTRTRIKFIDFTWTKIIFK